MPTQDNEVAKREFIEAYFEDLDGKVRFLSELGAQGRREEAQLLALVYIDGLANWLKRPSPPSAHNFCDVLIEHGGDLQFALVLPHWLPKRLPWDNAPKGAPEAIRDALAQVPEYEAQLPEPLLFSLRLADDHRRWLASEMWRGTLAHAVYVALRCPGVHELASGQGLSFSDTKWQGETLERVGLERLLAALSRISDHARHLSLSTNKWFGVE
jgi:hypothetical protein